MLLKKLIENANSGIYPMHMPGHKRNEAMLGSVLPYGIDITEIHGFDNLHDPQGILAETAKLASELYGGASAFPLINGSTSGILAAIGACTKRGDTLLMQRNCHISVYNAASLFGLKTAYLTPETDSLTGVACGISTQAVERGLAENPETALTIITSPTFEGVISDIRSIADTAHRRGIPLLVDGAHGAHLRFGPASRYCAVNCGADITVMSLHKTLPALTQCSLLHVCGELVNTEAVSRQLSIFQTSSPSYVLMASIDSCLRFLEKDSENLFSAYEENLKRFSGEIAGLKNLGVLCHGSDTLENHPGFFGFDSGKLVINTRNTELSGSKLMSILRDNYKIELEMACSDYAVALTGVCDTREGFSRLACALLEADGNVTPAKRKSSVYPAPPVQAMPLSDAVNKAHAGQFVPLKDAAGAAALEFVWSYPPGIPVIAPGELINHDIIDFINHLEESGISPKSTKGRLPRYIYTDV